MAQVKRMMGDKIWAKLGKKYGKGFEVGLKRAGLYLQRKSQEIVPIDTGILRNSARTEADGHGLDTVVTVLYLAWYAIYVHEIQATHKPGKQWKFLEAPARNPQNRAEMSRLVRSALMGA